MKNINFSYEKNNKKILKNFNYDLKQNIFYGIKGETGIGKSTFLDVISGLLKPNSGEILVNRKKIDIMETNWFNKISYVTQNVNLLDDTLKKNIALAVDEAKIDQEKIKKVLQVAQLESFDKELIKSSNLFLGERGVKISGGEKQRVGIARCLYFDRDIYIFDEATNALDKATELKILNNIRAFLSEKIVIMVSHKETTLKYCDEIIHLN